MVDSGVHSRREPEITLYIGDKNLSSWSFRAWLVLRQTGLPFREHKILLDLPETKSQIDQVSPSSRVPSLRHGDLTIWDSLAIAEYCAELAPQSGLWPQKRDERAVARSMVAEMHSGFSALRTQLSMNIRLRTKIQNLTSETQADIRRLLELWETGLNHSGGPFLFGQFGIADAFFAPVVTRFLSYGVAIDSPKAQNYIVNIERHPLVQNWIQEALLE